MGMASLWPIGKERAFHPPRPPLKTIAITHVSGGEEVGGATNGSDRDSTQKGGSCPAYRGPVQWNTATESRDGSDQSGGEWPGEEVPPS